MSATRANTKSSNDGAGPNSWTADENAMFMLCIMQAENSKLSVKGWDNIYEKAKIIFDEKYTLPALKQQYSKVRKMYFSKLNGTDDGDAVAAGTAGKAVPKRKRGAAGPSSAGEDDNDAAKDEDAAPARKTRQGKGKGKAKVKTEDDDATIKAEDESVTIKAEEDEDTKPELKATTRKGKSVTKTKVKTEEDDDDKPIKVEEHKRKSVKFEEDVKPKPSARATRSNTKTRAQVKAEEEVEDKPVKAKKEDD